MSDKLVLAYPTLHYISTGREKLHAMDTGRPAPRDTKTFCGQDILPGMFPQNTRKIDPTRLCKVCFTCLQPYWKVGKVRIESEEVL